MLFPYLSFLSAQQRSVCCLINEIWWWWWWCKVALLKEFEKSEVNLKAKVTT